MPVTFLQKALAQTLTFDVSRALYQSGTATCTLYAPNGATLQASTTATKGPSTTVNGSSAAGTKARTLTTTTGLAVGDVLWPLNAYGQTEPVVVAGVTSATAISTRHELRYAYAATNTIASRRLSLAVLAA